MELEPLPQEPQAPEPGGSRGSLPAGAAPLPPGDADLITASRSGDATAYDTASYLLVAVAPGAPAGTPPSISVDSGHDQVTARGTCGVSVGGLPARFAAPGWCTSPGWYTAPG